MLVRYLGRATSKCKQNLHTTGKSLITKGMLGFPGGSVVKNLPAMQEMWV